MYAENANSETIQAGSLLKLKAYFQLLKMRLSLSVAFSAGMAYILASKNEINWISFTLFIIGGLCISMVLSLVITPLVYYLLTRNRVQRRKKW